MLLALCSFGLDGPALYDLWPYSICPGETRTAESGACKAVALIKACREEEAKVVCLASKANTIWDALRPEIYGTLPK